MNRNKKGYILLETLVGIGILSIVIIAALNSISQNILAEEEIKKQSIAVTLAQKKMEELGSQDFFKTADAGDFGENWPGYKWEQASTSIQQTNFYGLVNIKLAVSYEVRSAPRDLKLESVFIIRKAGMNNWK